jgi:diadenosine tetraphosphate (Ap4A) HIT family hydrolase
MDQTQCPFCHLQTPRIVLEKDFVVAIFDGFPVADGHMLVVPKRHVTSLFDLPEVELAAVWKMVAQARGKILAELKPAGFNIGVNDGLAAGQTVMHAHVHIIPRQQGDTADPSGGVRWIMPEKARYWDEGQQ